MTKTATRTRPTPITPGDVDHYFALRAAAAEANRLAAEAGATLTERMQRLGLAQVEGGVGHLTLVEPSPARSVDIDALQKLVPARTFQAVARLVVPISALDALVKAGTLTPDEAAVATVFQDPARPYLVPVVHMG